MDDARSIDDARSVNANGAGPANLELLERCLAGDQRAWSRLVDRYERLVWAIAVREGLDTVEANDVMQETFGQLLQSLDRIERPERLGQWLATVARREVWRRQRRNSRVEVDLDKDDLEPAPDFVDQVVNAVEVYEAVARLGSPCKALIVGLFFDPTEPDYASLAMRLGRPIGSIGPLRGRCLQQLRTILEERSDG